jgi:hypothetical protein
MAGSGGTSDHSRSDLLVHKDGTCTAGRFWFQRDGFMPECYTTMWCCKQEVGDRREMAFRRCKVLVGVLGDRGHHDGFATFALSAHHLSEDTTKCCHIAISERVTADWVVQRAFTAGEKDSESRGSLLCAYGALLGSSASLLLVN